MDYDTIMNFIEDCRKLGKSWPEIEQSLTDALNAVAESERARDEADAAKAAIQSELHGNIRFNHLDCLPDLEKLTAGDVARVMIYYIVDNCPEIEQHIEDIEDLHDLITAAAKGIKESTSEVIGLIKMLISIKDSLENAKKADNNSKDSCKCGKCETKTPITVNKGLSDFDIVAKFLSGLQ